jgi:hypothetical protein
MSKERENMSVLKGYEPRFTPEGFLFWSHVDKNDRAHVARQMKVPESAVLILPYDTELGGKGGKALGNFSAFIEKTHEVDLNKWKAEYETIKTASERLARKFEREMLGPSWFSAIPELSLGEFKPLVIPLSAKILFDLETSTPKESAKKMTNGEKVFVSLGNGSKLNGTFIAEFWNPKDAEYFSTVLLDRSYRVMNTDTGRTETIEFLNVRSVSLSRREPDGVKLDFPYVKWTADGETREFTVNATQGRAFAAMAHVDKIFAIKNFRDYFARTNGPCPLRAGKEVIERLMVEFPVVR